MKKGLALVLVCVLCLLMLPAGAEQTTEWEMDSWEEGLLKAYHGIGGDVVVPSEIDGVAVRTLYSNCFNNNKDITSLVLPEGLQVIQQNAFLGCDNLKHITLPQSLRVIGGYSLPGNVEELTIPAGVAYIGRGALPDGIHNITFEGDIPVMSANDFAYFSVDNGHTVTVPDDLLEAYAAYFGKNNLFVSSGEAAVAVSHATPEADFAFDAESGTVTAYNGSSPVVEIPSAIGGVQVRAIGESAFEKRNNLFLVRLPEGLETIGNRAFAVNNNPLYMQFPQTLTSIGDEAFDSVAFFDAPNLPTSLLSIGNRAFVNMRYEGSADFVLPEGLVMIGDEAFSGASLQNLVLPSTLAYIGNRAFSDTYFTYMAINRYELPIMGEEPFYGKPLQYLADIDLPWDATRAQWEAFDTAFGAMGFENLTVWRNNPSSGGHCVSVDFNATERLGEYSQETGQLTKYSGTEPNLTVYTGINWKAGNVATTGVAEGVFKGNQTIRKFWPHHAETFTTISAEAFADSTLEYIEMYDSITAIGAKAFANCTGLTEMVLPPFLTDIAPDAYAGCANIAKADVQCDASIVPAEIFADCTSLTDVAFAKGDVPANILSGHGGVTRIALGEGVTAIGSEAFAGTGITDIRLPATLTTIGPGAFRGCTGLTEIELPESITQIAADAFAGCSGLAKVVVRCDAGVLSAGLFADCPALAYVSFDKGAIPDGILENASALTTVALGDGVTAIGANAFAHSALPGFVIPCDIDVDYTAFAGIPNLYMDASATDEQVAECTAALGYAWYDGITRVGEAPKLIQMPFVPTAAELFEFDPQTGTIQKYLGDEVDVIIPREIGGVKVREIAYGAFERCEDYTGYDIAHNQTDWVRLRSVVIPDTVEVLGYSLFNHCQQLETFICYAPLETTEKSQFMRCKSLDTVIFVNGVKQIDNYCFEESGPLGTLWLGDKLERVGIRAFALTGIEKLALDAVELDSGVVTGCENLTEIHFGSRATTFGDLVAQDCPNLSTVCLEMENAAEVIPSGMMLARLAEPVTVRLRSDATEADVRAAQYAKLIGSDMTVNVVCEPCTAATETPAMPDPAAFLPNAVLADAPEATPAPIPRVTPEPLPSPTPAPAPEAVPVATPVPVSALVPEFYKVQGTTSTMNSNGTTLYTAWTNADARFVAAFDENGSKLRTYDSESYAIVEEGGLTWYVPYTFGEEGKHTLFFDASADDVTYTGDTSKITVTIDPADDVKTDVPAVTFTSAKPTPAFRHANTYLSVRAGNNAKYLSAYDEQGNLMETWEADGNVTSWKGEVVWNILYRFEQDGRREITFRASADGSTYGAEKKAYITVRYAPKPGASAAPTLEGLLATDQPTEEPATEPTAEPAAEATLEPTVAPVAEPTAAPTAEPTAAPTAEPTPEPTAEPTAVPTAEPTAEPTAIPTAEPTVEPVAPQSAAEERIGVRYVCTEVEFQGGIRMPASTLGQEYSLTFHADGTLKFVMAGTDISTGATWKHRTVTTDAGEVNAFLIDYYGVEMVAIPTKTGLEMNYMDAMLLLFEPDAEEAGKTKDGKTVNQGGRTN